MYEIWGGRGEDVGCIGLKMEEPFDSMICSSSSSIINSHQTECTFSIAYAFKQCTPPPHHHTSCNSNALNFWGGRLNHSVPKWEIRYSIPGLPQLTYLTSSAAMASRDDFHRPPLLLHHHDLHHGHHDASSPFLLVVLDEPHWKREPVF